MPRTTIASSSSSTRTSGRWTSSIIRLRTPRPEASTSARVVRSQRYFGMRPSINELASLAEPEPDVLSSVSNVIEFPVRHDHDARLERDLVLALATADDLASGMVGVADRIRRTAGAAGVEWWAKSDDGVLELAAATGAPRGPRHSLPIGSIGLFAFHGGGPDPRLQSALASLTPIVRRRAAEERLARTTV